MTRDIFSGVSIKDILTGLGNILVALALGYLKLRMDSERRRRREHERRVAATIRASRQSHPHNDAGGTTTGKEDSLHSEHDDPTTSGPRSRIRRT